MEAPDFTLKNQNNDSVSLKAFRGKWILLYFYPKDNTPGCTTEACDFSRLKKNFEDLNVKILGVSPDSVSSHQTFIAQKNLLIDLLSDPEKTSIQSYGAWGKKNNYGKVYEGLIRSTFLIDPEGKIAASFKNVRATGHAERVLKKLQELQHE
ncbi:putative peroxiredoxin bcp [Waddlia chondrophila 2032/99]|uniref:thioredoxin-dependent peroxiredoxin n=2 Tax=Waddlia chondrophila TaxID=71667 RepID=D6YU46_WADCW|nr:thioredoxin-dependent thiol peroxidase [Waddlia chondrophila]ADI37657.1 Peroxiredoxin-4 [Waddlia chondrophila WSU 86-1044]CCB90596.1 putative peroxiredoxin bcp [Waddlia chondrophila 2032/99]